MRCRECPRRCGAERGADTQGYCSSPQEMRIARAELHFWEEPAISGTRGSGAIFFSGCPLKCSYCQNIGISRGGRGFFATPKELSEIIRRLEDEGAHNINLVTPTHYMHAIIPALRLYKPKIPVIYNCSGYESISSVRALKGLVDVFLPDMKYSDAALAAELSDAPDYPAVAAAAVKAMYEQTGRAVFDGDGMILSGTVVRHLILPGHVRNTLGVLRWLKNELPDATVSIMSQYFPAAETKGHPELSRGITRAEQQRVFDYMEKLGMENGWVQSREAEERKYVPQFYDEKPV